MIATATLDEAVAVLQKRGVIAYPTEGVWGVGCDPRDEAATMRLLALKQREVGKGLILIAADEAHLALFVDMDALDASQRDAVRASWPGPKTWIVPASAYAPAWITGDHDGIAVRVSAHPVVVALCEGFGGALVSTSANIATLPSPRTRAELDLRSVAGVDAVAPGETGGLLHATPIRDARDGRSLR